MIDDRHISTLGPEAHLASHTPADDSMGFSGVRMSASEFLRVGETRERYELVDGVVVMSPSPAFEHQQVLGALYAQLREFANTDPTMICVLDIDVKFDARLVYRPDLSAYRASRLQGRTNPLTVVPDLIIEVLSPGTKSFDLTTKKRDYARFGVDEYIIIDSSPRSAESLVMHFRRSGKRFLRTKSTGSTIKSAAWPGFVLDLKPIRTLLKSL